MDKMKYELLEGKKYPVNINSVSEFINASLYLGEYLLYYLIFTI